MTLKELFIEYITYKDVRVTKAWIREMQFLFDHMAPLYNKDISNITPADFDLCFTTEYKIKSPARFNMHITFLRALYSYAVKNQYTERNVGKLIDFVPYDKERKKLPTDGEMEALISVCDTPFKEFLIVMKNTLARVNELNSLKWEDINFKERIITLRTGKTGGKGRRDDFIPLNQEAIEALKYLKEWWDAPEMEYVFGGWYPWTYYKYNVLERMCRKAGIPIITFHTIRHYSASKLSSMGVPIRVIQDLLRHLSINTTQIYLQASPEDKRYAVDKLLGG